MEGLDKMMVEEFVDWFKTAVRNHYFVNLVNLDLIVVIFANQTYFSTTNCSVKRMQVVMRTCGI